MSIFNRHYKRYDSWYDNNRFAYLSELSALKRVVPRKGKGLEIGVGTGRFAAPLGIKFGIDPSGNMIGMAKKRGVNVRLACGERLPFNNSVFDYVAVIITICFTKNPDKVLKEAYRVLKKNGRIILGIVDKDSFLGRFYRVKKSVFYKEANFFSVRELTKLLKGSGFFNFSYYQTLYKFPAQIRSVQRPRKGSGTGGFAVISAKKRLAPIEKTPKKKGMSNTRNYLNRK